jgi:hypothetical protein
MTRISSPPPIVPTIWKMLPVKPKICDEGPAKLLVTDPTVRNCGPPTSWKVIWSSNAPPPTAWLNAPVAEVGLTPRLATTAALAGDAASQVRQRPLTVTYAFISLLIRD